MKSKMGMRYVEACSDCGELIEHYICDNEDCDCEDCGHYCECEKIDDSTEEEFRIFVEAVENILDVIPCPPCPECIFGIVAELAYKFKNIGWDNHRDYISACNED